MSSERVALIEAAQLEGSLACGLAMATAARVQAPSIAKRPRPRLRRQGQDRRAPAPRPLGSRGSQSRPAWSSRAVHLALGEASVAGAMLSEAEAILHVAHGWARLSRSRPSCANTFCPRVELDRGEWALSLTAAPLRLLSLLGHGGYTGRFIGERLSPSRTTVETHHDLDPAPEFGVSSSPRPSSAKSGCKASRSSAKDPAPADARPAAMTGGQPAPSSCR